MEMVAFLVLAVLAVAAGLGVIVQRSAVRSALFLLVNLCCLAGLYILLNAQFVALVQVIVYAGAIVVLFLFVVMLLGVDRAQETPDRRRLQWIIGGALSALLMAAMIWALALTWTQSRMAGALTQAGDVRQIGAMLLTDYAIPFEMVAVILLVAIIGAVTLARRKPEGKSDVVAGGAGTKQSPAARGAKHNS